MLHRVYGLERSCWFLMGSGETLSIGAEGWRGRTGGQQTPGDPSRELNSAQTATVEAKT